MSPRLLAILATLGTLVAIARGLRAYWAQLMEWTRAGQVEQQRLEEQAADRKRRDSDPWGQLALIHRSRAERLRLELRRLHERAAQRAKVPFGRRIRRGPRRRKD